MDFRRIPLALVAAAALAVPATAGAAASPRSAWPAARDGGQAADTLRGGTRADHLRGHEGPDRLFGGGGADLLTGDTGADRVSGGAGDDTLTGAAGGDTLSGGDGADVVLGGFGSDHIDGGAGDDTIDGANDMDFIRAGAGDDLVHGGSGPDLIVGGAGDDTLYADTGGDVLSGGDGDDTLLAYSTAAAKISCGSGTDTLYLIQPADLPDDEAPRATRRYPDCERTLFVDAALDPNQGVRYLAPDAGGTRAGSAKDDLLLGGPGADILRGGVGNDVLWGLRQAGVTSGEPDVLDAGAGDDTIYGGPGPQRIDAGSGDDFVNGGLGRNTIKAGPGNDTVRLRGSGTATVDGGPGNDEIYANGPAAGRVTCGRGTDTVRANRGDVVARDCERVIANAGSRPRRLRAAAGATYPDVVRATAGLTHWWRLGAVEGDAAAARDEITGAKTAAPGSHTERGATDDGDTAWLDTTGVLRPVLTDPPVRAAAATVELWARLPEGAAAKVVPLVVSTSVLAGGTATLRLERTATGAARVALTTDARRTIEARSADALLSDGGWHHLAVTRDGTTLRLYADGTEVASAADAPTPGTGGSSSVAIGGAPSGTSLTLDEVAFYSRALGAAEVTEHARVGDDGTPPVTTFARPLPLLIGSPYQTTLTTQHAGSRFRCRVDGTTDVPCAADLTIRLPVGPHTLQVRAVDRFGREEVNPVTRTFIVDLTAPDTFAAAFVGLTGEVATTLALGADEADATYECQERTVGAAVDPRAWKACRPGDPLGEDTARSVFVRAVDVAGNPDPSPVRISLKARTDAAENVVGALGAARAEVIPEGGGLTTTCRLDAMTPVECDGRTRLPLLRQGPHTITVTRAAGDLRPAVTATASFVVGLPAAPTLAAVQFPAVVESSAGLARRVPRVRFVLDAPVPVALTIADARGAVVAAFGAAGASGPNAAKIPAAALRRLGLGRYVLAVTAGTTTARLPFAVIPRNR